MELYYKKLYVSIGILLGIYAPISAMQRTEIATADNPYYNRSHDDTAMATLLDMPQYNRRRTSVHIHPSCASHTRQQLHNGGIPYHHICNENQAEEHDLLPSISHKRRKRERHDIERGTQYYNKEVDFCQILGLQEATREGHNPETIQLYSPFFTKRNVIADIISIHNDYPENANIQIYASLQTIINKNLGKEHMQHLVHNGIPVYIINNLHAKAAYIAYRDTSGARRTRSIMGSANITEPGFRNNVESWMILPKDIEPQFHKALANITYNSWQYHGECRPQRQPWPHNKQVRPVTPPYALLESYSSHINQQIAQSINNTQPHDRIMINTYSCNDPKCIAALKNAHDRGVKVDICINKGASIPEQLQHGHVTTHEEQPEMVHRMNLSKKYHDKITYIERPNSSNTVYYMTGNHTHSGESDANTCYVTKDSTQTQKIGNNLKRIMRKYLTPGTSLNNDTE